MRLTFVSYFLAKTNVKGVFSTIAYRTPQEANEASPSHHSSSGFLELSISRNGQLFEELYIAILSRSEQILSLIASGTNAVSLFQSTYTIPIRTLIADGKITLHSGMTGTVANTIRLFHPTETVVDD